MARGDRDGAGRAAGMGVFVLGVLLLLLVFYLAYGELVASGALSRSMSGGAAGNTALLVAVKGLFLFLLGFIASAIANKGIALYQASAYVYVRDEG